MPELREFVHTRLLSVPSTGGRVFQQGSILTAQTVKPYLVHHFGNNTSEGMDDEDNFRPNRQFIQIFIHVAQGDYGSIDDIMVEVRTALLSLTGRPGDISGIQYLETSQDLQDSLLQTYFRYMRFQLAAAR